jgi:NAD(P)-dependent dehydrogenase (short-subunit alcohol dehydrogenase family)
MPKSTKQAKTKPAQKQRAQPGKEQEMTPRPESEKSETRHPEIGKLIGMTAIITGGDSGIGRAVAIAFSREGASVVIAYLNEHEDARATAKMITDDGGEVLLVAGDIGRQPHCQNLVSKAVKRFGRVDILVNNAGVQYPQKKIEDISPDQLMKTFRINIFSQFYLVQATLAHMKKGGAIINTASVTAYRGSPGLIDYSATKGAIVAFTRSLSTSLAERGIRVNAVAPGPIWTPLIPATFSKEKVAKFGSDVPMKRPGEPEEVAPCYVFLASSDARYMTGQVLHPNGGEIVNT